MAGNLQAAARPGLAAGNDAQHNKVLQKQRAIKNTADKRRERGAAAAAAEPVPLGERRRLAADPGAQSPADWKRKRSAMEAGESAIVSAGTGARPRPGPALQSWPPFNRRFPAPAPPKRAPAPSSPGPPKPRARRYVPAPGERSRAVPRRAAPPGLAIRRRAAPPAGLEEEEALCSSPGSRCRRRRRCCRRRAPGSPGGSGAGLGLRRLG
ncbi:TCF3 fusion partner [Aquila chrysaetos chrysaetos]|uniref:TCF3 fusion partner n=1 Tax=Aquila chrysaetos chrysaetos TaxID=223781 RepID=UPI001B7D3362|nr:TCF3 fusion partner [Aquila chrysaetos chrysaetos]